MESSQSVAMGSQSPLLVPIRPVRYVSLHAGAYTVRPLGPSYQLVFSNKISLVVHLYSGMSHSNSVHNRVHTSPLFDPILIRVNPTHILTPYFLEAHFNIILPSIPMSPK